MLWHSAGRISNSDSFARIYDGCLLFFFSKNLVSKKQPKFFSKTTIIKLFCKPVRIRYSSLRVHANYFKLNHNCGWNRNIQFYSQYFTIIFSLQNSQKNVVNRTCFSHTSVARFRLKSETFLLPNSVWSLFYDVLLINCLRIVTAVFAFGAKIRVSFRMGLIWVFSKWNRNSVNLGNLINHWRMNWDQFPALSWHCTGFLHKR